MHASGEVLKGCITRVAVNENVCRYMSVKTYRNKSQENFMNENECMYRDGTLKTS